MTDYMSLEDLKQTFDLFPARVEDGQIAFDSGAASEAAAACQEYIDKMTALSKKIRGTQRLDGFGKFDTSITAKTHYDDQATQWAEQADQCVEIAKSMKAAFTAAQHRPEH